MRVRSSMRQLLVPATLVGLWACGQERSEPAGERRDRPSVDPRRADEGGYREIDVEVAGSVSGRLTWVGERPLEIHGQSSGPCADATYPALSLGPRSGVASAVVVLTGIREGRPREHAGATVRIERCGVAPHVVVVETGSTLRIESGIAEGEGAAHNAHATDPSGASRFDLALPTATSTAALAMDRPGILRVVDDAGDPLAVGWVHVVEHPYFALTDASGAFQMAEVPPGQYTLQLWHEGVRSRGEDEGGRPRLSAPILLSRAIVVAAGQDTAADFTMDLRVADAAGE